MGSRPPISIEPSSTAFHASPGAVRPRWSMAMYSVVVKQSCVSTASSWAMSAIPARLRASSMARRTCGKT